MNIGGITHQQQKVKEIYGDRMRRNVDQKEHQNNVPQQIARNFVNKEAENKNGTIAAKYKQVLDEDGNRYGADLSEFEKTYHMLKHQIYVNVVIPEAIKGVIVYLLVNAVLILNSVFTNTQDSDVDVE